MLLQISFWKSWGWIIFHCMYAPVSLFIHLASFYYNERANGEGLPLIDNWILKWERVAKVAQLSLWASYQIVWGSRLTVQNHLHRPPFCSHLDLLSSVYWLVTTVVQGLGLLPQNEATLQGHPSSQSQYWLSLYCNFITVLSSPASLPS